MPSWKVSMRASMTNQTSHFGIMGGLYNRKISGRSSTNRVTSRLVIPPSATTGLQYMRMNNLLSKNPLGSGGVGKVVKSKPCNCGTLGKPEVKEDTTLTLVEVAGKEDIHLGDPIGTHDTIDSIVGVCNKFFIQMKYENGWVFDRGTALGFVKTSGGTSMTALYSQTSNDGFVFGGNAKICGGGGADVSGCSIQRLGDSTLQMYDKNKTKIYYYKPSGIFGWMYMNVSQYDIDSWVYAMCSECSGGYFPNASVSDVSSVNNLFTEPSGGSFSGVKYGNTYGCLENSKCPAGFSCDVNGKTQCAAGTYSGPGDTTCIPNTFTKCPNGNLPFGNPPVFCCSFNKQDSTVPSCGGMTAGTDSVPNNDHMCYTHVPTGQDKDDITCGDKVPQCTYGHYQTTEHTHLGES